MLCFLISLLNGVSEALVLQAASPDSQPVNGRITREVTAGLLATGACVFCSDFTAGCKHPLPAQF